MDNDVTTQRANFAARARVVDLLGREQIADAPTAVSELLKNAIDAYAREAEVRFNSKAKCLQIEDNGLGMRTQDLLGKWLVLATDAKRGKPDLEWLSAASPEQQRMVGIYPQLGEKGIGRLAAAHLGRGALIWTRWGHGTSAEGTLLFVHWHLFLHPRLRLDEIEFPYIQLRGRQAKVSDALNLLRSLDDWLEVGSCTWKSDDERQILHDIRNDIREGFPKALAAGINFREDPGTLFYILGTTPDPDSARSASPL